MIISWWSSTGASRKKPTQMPPSSVFPPTSASYPTVKVPSSFSVSFAMFKKKLVASDGAGSYLISFFGSRMAGSH